MKRLAFLVVPLLFAAGCGDKATPGKNSSPPTDPGSYSGGGAEPKDGKVALSGYNTAVKFVGTKPDGQHDGGFKNVTGSIHVSEKGVVARIEAEFDIESMYTDQDKLTAHLKSADFFDAKTHPKATFVSTRVDGNAAKPGEITVTGDLTLHGVKKSITFPAITSNEDGKFTLTSTFKINRQDFEMKYGPGKVNDDVTISVSVGKAAK